MLDGSPIHKPNSSDIFNSCRRGDLDRVRYLTEEKEINLNVRDIWDSTPLYYACLCGHLEVVQYLLENGSTCDASTFDGERCIYGALTDQIRKALMSYSVLSTSVKRREGFQEFLRRLLEDGNNTDISFQLHDGTWFRAHRFLLAARSSYFEEQLDSRWGNLEIVSVHNKLVDCVAFRKIIEWLYIGQAKLTIPQSDDVLRLCKQCKLAQLKEEVECAITKANSFVSTKRGIKIRNIQVESPYSRESLQQDLFLLSQQTIPIDYQSQNAINILWRELPMSPRSSNCEKYADINFDVQSNIFCCHKAMFWTRSEYFRALIDDHFHEGSWDAETARATIPINHVEPEIFAVVVSHVYSNVQQIDTENVYDVLEAADIFLLPDLKRQCGAFLENYLEISNVIDLVNTARLFVLPRLEHACVEFIAKNIDEIVSDPKFRDLVQEDAKAILNRQETDSVDIIDEIRYVLRTCNLSTSGMDMGAMGLHSTLTGALDEASRKLERLNDMLDEMGFEI